MSKKIFVIPDTQVKAGVKLDHLTWAGQYAAAKKPDVIVQIGDFADMPSLSSYDVGKKSFEGRRYTTDIEVAHKAMEMFLAPIVAEQERMKRTKEKVWKPRLVLTYGNHEQRIVKAVEADPKLEGVLSLDDLGYKKYGWEVYPFLEPVKICDVMFNHYFPTGVMGRPTSTARALLIKMHMSCVGGHLPGLRFERDARADGRQITSVICGSFYQHTEDYMSPIVNRQHWHGIVVLHGVQDGEFDIMPVSMNYLKHKYGK